MTSQLTGFDFIPERSHGTPGLWNRIFSQLSENLGAVNQSVGGLSGDTITASGQTIHLQTHLDVAGQVHAQGLSLGSTPPSQVTTAAITVAVNSASSDYLYLTDSSGARSSYVIGSRAGGTADGLNIWDASGATLLVSFSKQSIRFFQNVVGPVFDVGGALADTLNAATFGTGADSIESRIQAAISAASIAGISRVYVPANMYPYSGASVSHDTRVQMVREGGDWTVHDALAYGANGNGSTGSAAANTAAIQSAISGANADPQASGLPGGVAYVPPGRYVLSGGLRVPVAVTSGQVILRGAGMRVSYLFPQTSAVTAVLFGSATLDASGSFASQSFYCGLEDLSLSGSLITGPVCAVQFSEMQKGWIRNSIIESFSTPGAIGLYLRGSSGGAAPHNWRCGFMNVLVATTYRPLILENADENDFFNCNFAVPPGLTSAVTAVHMKQGRNNRWFGVLVSGEASSLTTGRPNYTGFLWGGETIGDCSGNQVHGGVAEGFDSGHSVSSNATNIAIMFNNPSISRVGITDSGSNTLYWAPEDSLSNPIYQWPDGTANTPMFGFRSENSLGWYRSAASVMALAPEGRLLVGSGTAFSLKTQPEYGFGGESQLGMLRSAASSIGFYAGNVRMGQFVTVGGVGSIWVEAGSATSPGVAWNNEPKLGFYLSGTSAVGLSYGQFQAPTGTAVQPSLAFSSESSLGFYVSAVSTVALSYGSLAVPSFLQLGNITGGDSRPALYWSGDSDTGLAWAAQDTFDLVSKGGSVIRLLPVQIQMGTAFAPGFGTASKPLLTFTSEISLGWYRSAASAIALSYGQFQLPAGTALQPSLAYSSESSLGWYRSGTSALALSYGTIDLTNGGAVTSVASLTIKSGANNSCGTTVLGSNGSVNVANSYVKTGDLIFLTDVSPGGTIGSLEMLGIRNSSGFTIASTNVADTSTVAWLIVRPG